ncbi:MAG TPA: tetratricopeptide repeat protein [Candidatus Obscuribacterales bacterium]
MQQQIGASAVLIIVTLLAASVSLQSCSKAEDASSTVKRAQALMIQGKAPAAESLLNGRLKILGLSDSVAEQRACLLTVLGRVYLQQEKPMDAEACFLESVSIDERKFGIDSPELIEPLDGLRQAEFRQQKFSPAEREARRVLAIADSHYKANDPRLEAAISNVLAVACIGGKCKDETELDQRLVAIREQIYGPDNQNTRAARLILAESYRHKKDYANTVAMLQKNVESCRRAAPAELIAALNNVAHALVLAGDSQKALDNAQEALDIEQKSGNKIPQQNLSSLQIKARVLAKQGKYKEAEKTYAELVEKFKTVFRDKNPHLADILVEYGDVLNRVGKTSLARQVKTEAESIYKR